MFPVLVAPVYRLGGNFPAGFTSFYYQFRLLFLHIRYVCRCMYVAGRSGSDCCCCCCCCGFSFVPPSGVVAVLVVVIVVLAVVRFNQRAANSIYPKPVSSQPTPRLYVWVDEWTDGWIDG